MTSDPDRIDPGDIDPGDIDPGDIDPARIDAAALALLHLGLHDGNRAWKSFDWEVMNRLHAQGWIGDPVSKAKAVTLTEDGLREAERQFRALFARKD